MPKISIKLFKKTLSITLAFLITILIIPNFDFKVKAANWIDSADTSWYVGHESDTSFSISTAEQLAGLAKLVNQGNGFLGKTIELTDNIVLNDISNLANWGTSAPTNTWTAIGNSINQFRGTFDGKSHTISGIYINILYNYQGLFGYSTGTIKNVGVINSYIKGGYYTGGIVGSSNSYNSTVSNCYNTGTVSGAENVGGIVGQNYGNTISNCYNTGAVSGSKNVGGVAGVHYGEDQDYFDSTIENCYNTGIINGNLIVGGIVGNNNNGYSIIKNCHNEGTVNGTGTNIGGVAGSNAGLVLKSYNTGDVDGKSHWVGGVVGRNAAAIDSCYNTGTVKGTGNNVGGVTGYSELLVKNSFNTGAVEGGANFTGGIVGGNNPNSTIENCYNTGAVVGVTYTGGVAGYNENIIKNCYYYGYNVGISNQIDEAGKSTPFAKIADNPLGAGKTTYITEQATADINTAWSNSLGAGFAVAFSDNYSSSYTSKATVSGTTISAVSVGTSTILGRTLTITQNELTSSGFTGATKTIIVPISMPLSVTANGGGTTLVNAVTPSFNTNLSGSTTYDKNTTATALIVSASVTDTGTVSYQWYKNSENNNTTGTAITGATNATYTPLTDTVGTSYYYVIATNTNNSVNGTKTATTTSGIKTVVVNALVNAATPSFSNFNIFGEATYAKNDTATALNGTAIVSDGGTVTYQWYKNTTNGSMGSTEISGATNATYTPPTDTMGTNYYYVIVINTNNSVNGNKTASIMSGTKKIVVNGNVSAVAPSFNTNLSGSTTYNKDTTATELNGTATVSDSGTVTYQWYNNTTNSTTGGTAITGATNATYTPLTGTIGTSYYYVIATNTNNSVNGTKTATATSGIKKVIVNAVSTPEPKTIDIIQTPTEIKNPEKISIKPIGEAFSQSVEVRMKDDPTVKKAIEDSLDKVLKSDLKDAAVFPLDISLYVKGTDTKVQPNEGTSVVITIPIPESLLANKDNIKVVCIIDGKLTILDTKVIQIDGVWCVQFTATHFSPYAMVVDTANELSNTTNPKTSGNNTAGTFSIIAILSVATLAVVSKKRKFKVVKK